VINKESTCEQTTKQQAKSSNRRSKNPQATDLYQMIQCHEEKGAPLKCIPPSQSNAPRNQQQISINVMKIINWNLTQYEV
jgi:hypothetical protein